MRRSRRPPAFATESSRPWRGSSRFLPRGSSRAIPGSYAPPQRAGKYKGGGVGPSPCYSYSACVVEVDVDVETGEVKPREIWIAHDVGRALNPLLVEGQVEGSVYM